MERYSLVAAEIAKAPRTMPMISGRAYCTVSAWCMPSAPAVSRTKQAIQIAILAAETLVTKFDEPADVIIFDGFKDLEEEKLRELYDSLGLAMTFKDFQHIQNYFRGEEDRDPSMTEIRGSSE